MVVGSRNDQRTIQRKVVQSTLFAGAIATSAVRFAFAGRRASSHDCAVVSPSGSACAAMPLARSSDSRRRADSSLP